MLSFAFYLLKVIICSAVLFGYYWLFLRNKVFHGYNRFYLLAIIVLSLTLPVIKISIWHKADEPQTNVVRLLQVVNSSDQYMDDVIVYNQQSNISKEQVFLMAYLLICSILFFLLLQAIIRIWQLVKNNPATTVENIHFIKTDAKGTPFSFFKFIFWNNAIDISTKTGSQVFKHEVAHVQEKHSHDKLFINIVLILFWSNPFFWLIRKELNMIHEFIADKKAVEDGNTADFAAMILQATYPTYKFPIANNFFYSPIKRRLLMLTKQHKTKVSYISRLLVLPLAVIVFAAFTIKTKAYIENNSTAAGKTITVVINPGHGGKDNGAVSNGFNEKDITLSIAKKIKELYLADNIKIVLTRETDIYQSPPEIVAITKEMNADLFISIHLDGAPETAKVKKTGLSVFVAKDQYPNAIASKLLASSVISSFKNNYGLTVADNPQQRNYSIWVLQNNTCPAILIEAGCINNKTDLEYLKTNEAIELIAKNILNSIVSFQYIYKNPSATEIKENAGTQKPGKEQTVALKEVEEKNDVNFKPLLERITKDTYVDASQVAVTGDGESIFPGISKYSSPNPAISPLMILNGKEISSNTLNTIDPKNIETVRLLTPETAIPIYGKKAKNGVMLINAKTSGGSVKGIPAKDGSIIFPPVRVGDLASTKPTAEEFKKQTKIYGPEGLKLVSGTVYFTGAGFPDVISAVLRSDDLTQLKKLIDKSKAGTTIVFDELKFEEAGGHYLYANGVAYTLTGEEKEVPVEP